MAVNKEGNEIGVIIEADDLLTQIAKKRLVDEANALKPVVKVAESRPKAVQKTTATAKA